jgi:hypothetical protein
VLLLVVLDSGVAGGEPQRACAEEVVGLLGSLEGSLASRDECVVSYFAGSVLEVLDLFFVHFVISSVGRSDYTDFLV